MAITECKDLKLVSPLLKTWSFKDSHIINSKISLCGNFLAVKGDSTFSIIHMTLKYQEDLRVKYNDFIWGFCDLSKEKLLVATETCFLVTIDDAFNIDLHSVSKHPNKLFQHKFVKRIDLATLKSITEIANCTSFSLMWDKFDTSGIQQRIACLVNKSTVIIIALSSTQQEPFVENTFCNQKKLLQFIEWQCCEKNLYLLREDFYLQILDKLSLTLLQEFVLQDLLDIKHLGIINDGAVVFDSNYCFHFYELPVEQNDSEIIVPSTGEWKTRLYQLQDIRNLSATKTISAPLWMKELSIKSFHVSRSIILIHGERNIDKSFYFFKYVYGEDEFTACKMQPDVSLCFDDGDLHPVLFVSLHQVTLPFFAVSQEHLIDKIIQFSDITMAEKICKTNEWHQFSIPLHTLELGLQHRQLDAVEFFLKSRDKPFTRHWKPSSFKLHNSNSVSIEPDELKNTIKKLKDAIFINSSKGKQRHNFFEGLLMITIRYLNRLIQDGIEALKSLPVATPTEKVQTTTNQKGQVSSFNFFYDLPETLKFLAQTLVELRKYLKVPAKNDFNVAQLDEVDGRKKYQVDLKSLLINGKMGTFQKTLICQGSVENGRLDSAIAEGKAIALKMLELNDLKEAENIILNMGLDPNKELKCMYLESISTNLQRFMYTSLKIKGLLNERDDEDYMFIKELEKHYFSENQDSFSKFTLMHVQKWDSFTRKRIIFDAIFLKDIQATIKCEDSEDLWSYLISHNRLHIIKHWLLNDGECKQILPAFNIHGVDISSTPVHMKEQTFNLLVKNGYFPQFLLNNFVILLEHLGKNGLIFGNVHPFDHYKYKITAEERKGLVENFNCKFIQFCQENSLPVLMWQFVTYHKIHLSNLQFPDKLSVWMTLMLCVYDYVHNPDPFLFSNILLQNAALVSQSGSGELLNNLVANKQVPLALSMVLVSGKSLEQVLEGEDQVFKIDKQLLYSSLEKYPKVLQSIHSSKSNSSRVSTVDITMYMLIQDNTEIDVTRWFSWQESNKMALKEENILTELPHFSHPQLVSNFAQVAHLTYDYYLREGRPTFAYLVFQKEPNSCLNEACAVSYKLAIENFTSLSVQSSCCFFLELLHQEYEIIKVDVKVLDLIHKYWNKPLSLEKKYSLDELCSYLIDSLLKKKNLMKVLKLLEDSIEHLILENKVEKFSYEAVWHWQLAVDFCRIHGLPVTLRYIQNCCTDHNWLQFILFIHFYQVPSSEAVSAINVFIKNNVLKEHLVAIVKSTKEVSIEKLLKRKKKKKVKDTKSIDIKASFIRRDVRAQFYSRIGAATNKDQLIASSPSEPLEPNVDKKDAEENSASEIIKTDLSASSASYKLPEIASFSGNLLDTLLECEKCDQPWKALLYSSYVSFHSFLPIVAACYEGANHLDCICTWYLCNMDDHDRTTMIKKLQILDKVSNDQDCSTSEAIETSSIEIKLFNHVWKTVDLLALVKEIFLQRIKYGSLPSQGFQIFMQGHLLISFLEFLESFLNKNEHFESVKFLSKFQTDFILSQQSFNKKTFLHDLTLETLEDFTQECMTLMISMCNSQHDVQSLLNIIVESKYGNKFSKKVPDFNLLKKTVHIIYNANITYQLQSLFTIDKVKLYQEIKKVFSIMLENRAYDQACLLADLFELPFAADVITCKVREDLSSLEKTCLWSDLHIRNSFWKKTDHLFFESSCLPEVAGSFFEQLVANDSSLSYGEKASLLMYSLKWYSFNKSADSNKLLKLYKLMWFYKVKSLVGILNKQDDVYNFTKEPSFNQSPAFIRELDLEFIAKNDTSDPIVFEFSNEQELDAYHDLINCLLDCDCVAEASRIAVLFKKTSTNLDVVKTCKLLAQGNLSVELVSNNVKAILASTTSSHASISSIFDLSVGFSRAASISSINLSCTPLGEMHDFVFIEDVRNALKKLTMRAKYGKKSCERELLMFEVASALQVTYDEIANQDHFDTLKKLLDSDFDKRRKLSKLYIKVFSLESTEVATFVADSMISMIKICCSVDRFTAEQLNTTAGSNEDIKLPSFDDIVSLLQLTNQPSSVGQKILKEMHEISREMNDNRAKDWKYSVDLLIYAHHCFTICCDMEGIVGILKAARISTKLLASDHQYNLLVRLLTHIGRFKEMFYVIETLYNHHHFESLCRKGILNEGKLKQALIDFMLTYHEDDKDNFKLILVGFGMYREHAEQILKEVESKIKLVLEKLSAGSSKEVVPELKDIQQYLSYAADYFQKDDCHLQAHKCLQTARLVELQIHLLPSACCILGLSIQQVKQFLNEHENFLEAFLVAETYGLNDSSIWIDPLYEIVLTKANFNYLQQFICYQYLSSSIVTELALKARLNKSSVAISNMKQVLRYVRDVKVKLKTFKELGFTDMEKSLNESSAGAYLRDQVF